MRELHFVNCEIEDDQLKVIAKLPKLESLHIVNFARQGYLNEVSGDGIMEIAKIETLRHLVLKELGVQRGELESLKRLTNLEWLNVSGNKSLTNDDASIVLDLPRLTGADFDATQVNEELLPMFRSLPKLEWVTINPSSPEVEEKLSSDESEGDHRLRVYFR